jgi:hypothetical protein
MKLNGLFIFIGILGLFFGVLTVLIPGGFSAFYGGELTEAGKLDTQLQGAAYLGLAVLLLMITKSKDAAAQKAVVLGLLVMFVIGLVVSLKAQLAGFVNVWGWSTVAIHGIIILCLLFFMMRGAE